MKLGTLGLRLCFSESVSKYLESHLIVFSHRVQIFDQCLQEASYDDCGSVNLAEAVTAARTTCSSGVIPGQSTDAQTTSIFGSNLLCFVCFKESVCSRFLMVA